MDNLRAVMTWSLGSTGTSLAGSEREQEGGQAQAGLGVHLVSAVWWVWPRRLHWLPEGEHWLRLALESGAGTAAEQAWCRVGLGVLLDFSEDARQAREFIRLGVQSLRALGRTELLAEALLLLGVVERPMTGGDVNVQAASVEEGLALMREVGDDRAIARAVMHAAKAMDLRRDDERQRAALLATEGLRLATEHMDRFALGMCSFILGMVKLQERDFPGALAAFTVSTDESRGMGDQYGVAAGLAQCAMAARAQGDLDRALTFLEESAATYRSINYHGWWLLQGLQAFGDICLRQGQADRARSAFLECLTRAESTRSRPMLLAALEGLARVAAVGGRADRAFRLAGAVAVLQDPALQRASDLRRDLMACLEARGDGAPGPDEQARFWAEGEKLPLEQAIADARDGQAQNR